MKSKPKSKLEWKADQPAGRQVDHAALPEPIRTLEEKVAAMPEPVPAKGCKTGIRVACILDTFSYECFKYECDLMSLKYDEWRKQLRMFKPDFLFVESAWSGRDGEWKGKLGPLPEGEESEVKSIIEYCKKKGIPTVFWGKEDPADYERFLRTAVMFDYIFTTDSDCIARYRQDAGHNRVYLLPFAAQPAIHNPVGAPSFEQRTGIAFSGSWYGNKHPDRNPDLENMLRAAKKFGLTLYNRFQGSTSKMHEFPAEFQDCIIGSLPYMEMVKAYKLHKVFLNVNSIKGSPTMFSRRLFELLAAGTVAVSNESVGVERFFSGIVPLCSTQQQFEYALSQLILNPEHSRRRSLLGIREVHKKHLYKHRFQHIVDSIGLANWYREDGVSVIVCTNKNKYMHNVFQNYNRQAWPKKELIIILNQDDMQLAEWENKWRNVPEVTLVQLPETVSLGNCLNDAAGRAKYPIVAKFDDDDYYGPHYLTDMMHAFEYSGADIVGKLCHYAYLEGMQTLIERFPNQEHKFVNIVAGGTLCFKRHILQKVQFKDVTVNEITPFVRDGIAEGFKAYSADRYNYVYRRNANLDEHTWKKSEQELLFEQPNVVSATAIDYAAYVTV